LDIKKRFSITSLVSNDDEEPQKRLF